VGSDRDTTATPAVSVIVTTYNHERFVDGALDSVLRQSFRDFELVIVDDCSTDGTPARIAAWLARTGHPGRLIVNPTNRGICASRNLALRECRADLVSCLSGDDCYEPEKLARQVSFFGAADASVAAVYGDMRLIDEHGHEIGSWFAPTYARPEGAVLARLIAGNFIPAPTVMTRRAALDEVGGYDESLAYEDYDMWLRLTARYEMRYLPGTVVDYRLLTTSLSRDPGREVVMRTSRCQVLLKWYGRDPALDRVILRRAWANGRRVLALDELEGRRILETIYALDPNVRRRAFLASSEIPGERALLAAAIAVRDRVTARRRAWVIS